MRVQYVYCHGIIHFMLTKLTKKFLKEKKKTQSFEWEKSVEITYVYSVQSRRKTQKTHQK